MHATTSTTANPNNSSDAAGRISADRGFKRKFEDAIHSLDRAVGPSVSPEMVPPAKKPKVARSLYSTLAKYGIKKEVKPPPSSASTSRLDSLSKTAPHLVAILNRAASRTRKPTPFKAAHPPTFSVISAPASASEYRPSSTSSFLSRLSTYKLTTYANKPAPIDAVAAAKCGWVNEGKDRLVCGICGISWVVANKDGLSRDAATTLVEKQRVSLVEMHKDGCPWKSQQCEDSIYRVPLQTPTATTRELKARAAKLELVMKDVHIKHPLSSSQVQALMSVMRSFKLHADADVIPTDEDSVSTNRDSMDVDSSPLPEPSETAILTALFGWSITLPTASAETARPSSISRAASVMSSAPSTPSRPRFVYSSASRSSTPVPASPLPPRPISLARDASSMSVASVSPSTLAKVKVDSTLLYCSLCQRRIGVWAFVPAPEGDEASPMPSGPSLAGETTRSQPRRQFDVLKEHRSYCPYVVKSTVLPSLPVPPSTRPQTPTSRAEPYTLGSNPSIPQINGQNAATEGWKAVLSMILRHGAVQKQRLGRPRSVLERQLASASGEGTDEDGMTPELDQVEAMVEGVKSRGGRELLRYVKGLLG